MEHDIAHLTPTLVACVPASSGQKSPDTTRHALDQGPHPSWLNCSSQCVCVCVRGGHPCLGSRLTFDPIHAQLGSCCLDSQLASPWPQHPVGPKRLPCHVLYGAGDRLGCTQSYVQTPPSPMATYDSSGSGCTDAGSWLHPPRLAHSSTHGGLHPILWLTGHDFHH